ncbi:MAG: hydrogenase maturation nickel metallochaperone HypA [Erysipelotrichaceae bacterium]
MHELGIVYEVIRVVDRFAQEHQLTSVEKIVLEIGELSQAIPRFLEECYPAAVDDTAYANTALEIITLPAMAKCDGCGQHYNVIAQRKTCPVCGSQSYALLSGQEFTIKEIVGC